ECKECGYTFEKFQSMTEDSLTTCPNCEKESLRRLIGGGMGVIFKGSGFYVNDAKGKSSTSGPAKKCESSGSDSSACSGCAANS
ncbi:MAG: zinc ribbon domain-containing protein, partial [Spirochaetales bacterium]|nr:zinc ribbon domain-containing protein [Spirochaetales bacterium]